MKFVHLPKSVYDRGRSSVNRKEARTVAERALRHYQESPDKSLGVGAFNIKQQKAILEEVELQLRCHPEMEEFFSSGREEHFFVKNLETIQGDERDVIFLSIGFGFDESGRLSRHFGPLNHEGGERRLNVLISRAREKCVVFSNFRAADLQLDANAPFGVRALKVFLDYAENRNLQSIEVTGEDTGSPFEDSVYNFLRDNGHEVRKQVGCAGYRVDLAVVDPRSPGRYLIGIECDGAKYHSSRVARDRDRLRQQILENLGWKLHRVWSTDWYRNRRDTQKRLLDAVQQAKHEPPASSCDSHDLADHTTVHDDPSDAAGSDQRSKSRPENDPLDTEVQTYEVCSSLGITIYGELHERPIDELARAVKRVVNVEGPVHFDEVVRRIRSLWGLGRAGGRIRHALGNAVWRAFRLGQIRKRGDFLWPVADRPKLVRRRTGDPPPKIEIISDEEIVEAIKLVLRHQFATMRDELIVRSSRLFGIQATHGATAKRIRTIIDTLVHDGVLREMPNGMVDLSYSE